MNKLKPHLWKDSKSASSNEGPNHLKWTKQKPILSGFYLLRGKHWVYKFRNAIALVEVENKKVYMHSQHGGYNLNSMFKTEFLGPFENREDLINAQSREIKRHNS